MRRPWTAAPQKSAAQKGEPKKAAPVQPVAASAAPAKATGGKADGIAREDTLAVKGLVGRPEARPLHALIDAFAK